VVIEFNTPSEAYRASWYPGARSHGPRAIAFEHKDFSEILRALRRAALSQIFVANARQSKDDYQDRHVEAWLIVQAVAWYLSCSKSRRSAGLRQPDLR
jgi:hypothetical protein